MGKGENLHEEPEGTGPFRRELGPTKKGQEAEKGGGGSLGPEKKGAHPPEKIAGIKKRFGGSAAPVHNFVEFQAKTKEFQFPGLSKKKKNLPGNFWVKSCAPPKSPQSKSGKNPQAQRFQHGT